jgi:CRP-like cAMP-binding protein/anti-anti-sigma regulatory factor
MVIASALFLAKIGKAIIRRRYRGDQVHSRKVRVRPLTEILETEGWRIAVYELQGALFFGSAENLTREVEDSAPTFTHCILDLALVTEIDSTGASSLVDLDRRLAQAGARLSLSHVEPGLPLWQVFESMDVLDAIGREDCYSDTDAALEAAEEALLAQFTHLGDVGVPISLDQMEITEGLTPAELATLGARLCPQTYQRGALVICEGAADRDLYFLTRGTISVGSRSQEGQHTHRLRSFTAGVVFGEMAMLDGKPRSADVWAEEDAEMLCLSLQEFERLQTREPALAVKLTLNLTKAIARNLRRASREIAALG